MSIDPLMRSSSLELPYEHIDALQAVDLRLCFGAHGVSTVIQGYGPAVLGVQDNDYKRAGAFVDTLSLERGDVFAIEGLGHEEDLTATSFTEKVHESLQMSPYVKPEDFSALTEDVADSSSMTSSVWEAMRKKQLLTVIEYAAGKAVLKGMDCRYADADAKQAEQWYDAAMKMLRGKNLAAALLLERKIDHAEERYRNDRAVECLGRIAAQMEQKTDEKPVLGFMQGVSHRKHIESLLTQYDIPFTSSLFTPDDKAFEKKYRALKWSHRLGRGESPNRYYIRRWVENAEARSA